jgi:hypothetical protein
LNTLTAEEPKVENRDIMVNYAAHIEIHVYFESLFFSVQNGIGSSMRKLEWLMSTHTSILVDSVGPPSAKVCRTAVSFA